MADTTIKRHPIRGFLYGILFGLGLVFVVVGQGWAALGTTPPFLVFVGGLVVGTLWGAYGPAKAPKGAPPAPAAHPAPPESSRFDHLGPPAGTQDVTPAGGVAGDQGHHDDGHHHDDGTSDGSGDGSD